MAPHVSRITRLFALLVIQPCLLAVATPLRNIMYLTG